MAKVSGLRCSQGAVAYAVLGILLLTEMIVIAVQTGTPVFFTLDDPYIHLALAESIAHGEYGINPGEYASPSSSILYPFLLAPFAALVVGEWGALALNVAASFGILAVWRQLFIRFGFASNDPAANAGALLATLAVNGVALVFTGMEHTPHIFCTLATMVAIIDVAEGKPTPWFMIPIAFAGALLRYEGGAGAGAAALALLWSGFCSSGSSIRIYQALPARFPRVSTNTYGHGLAALWSCWSSLPVMLCLWRRRRPRHETFSSSNIRCTVSSRNSGRRRLRSTILDGLPIGTLITCSICAVSGSPAPGSHLNKGMRAGSITRSPKSEWKWP
ncbi:hypothetical protein F2P47_13410 [Parvibaculum sedimenti]|uniref:Glycosyltransferase RgtA/B/C/D-like domain-containing protein n=1 Tax=Parvibaculum sedimenti TaxID=2608632 RepID=A0A6N6VJV0_9HYPH|nr:hypothetical protein [Parvibaculum sedimenti]KAB7739212.1 hypothetical protein F2P47_13410 [Parvibaculum sedimenti]